MDVGGSKLVELDGVGRETRICHRWKTLMELAAAVAVVVDGKTEVEVVGTWYQRKTKP